ncbi:hypothetical protein MCOR01_002772 [Pyricularia oryzae]|nr:hypothetical protein MCOR01_002772 [Pyricularia oryzae]
MPLRMMLYDSLEPQDVNTNQHRSSSIQCPNCQQTVFPSEDDYTEHHKKKHPEDRVQLAHPLRHSKQTNQSDTMVPAEIRDSRQGTERAKAWMHGQGYTWGQCTAWTIKGNSSYIPPTRSLFFFWLAL